MTRFLRYLAISMIILLSLVFISCYTFDVTTSLFPIYNESNLVYFPRLEGTWKMVDEDGGVILTFSGTKEKKYLMLYQTVSPVGRVLMEAPFTAHIARIGEKTYIDIHSEKGPQRNDLLTKRTEDNILDDAVKSEKENEYGIGIEAELIELESGTPLLFHARRGSPAYNSGLLRGDRIISVNGHPTENVTSEQFKSYARGRRGSKVIYTIVREGEPEPLKFSMSRDSSTFLYSATAKYEDYHSVGITVGILDTALTVTHVKQGSPGQKAGIRLGDRILSINGRLIKWMNKFVALHHLKGPKGSRTDILVEPKVGSEPIRYTLTREIPPAPESISEEKPPPSMIEKMASLPGPFTDLYRKTWLGSHMFLDISIENQQFTLKQLNYDWLSHLLNQQPDTLSHIRIWDDEFIVLTASPEEMHDFLLHREKDPDMFPDSVKFIFKRTDKNPV